MNHEQLRSEYRRKFVATEFPDLVSENSFLWYFYQRELHFVFESLSERKRSLLDVGCGPITCNVFPATKSVQDVVLSDFLLGNRLEVEKWLRGAPDAIDWSCYSESLARLEGFSDIKRGAEEITARTRKAIRKVVPGDILTPGVLQKEHQEKFDVVLSCFCLEAASLDEATFRTATQNVGDLIYEGGILILCGVLGRHEFSVGGVKFPCLCLTPGAVKDAVVRAGFRVNLWRSLYKPGPLTPTIDSAYVVAAEKL
ncbi:phenylethanolamine N-methyltransferase-like [Ixodes scapularis]|uniref:phenylethanolamine N-methyltransferase-like n=1 Tax=Ixodes scapularis TaxID=6945 RepID=UPI001A9F8D6D|nr:phenylethanolamine N-methyltransferase-like [Ixodes scapularis]